MLMKLLKYDLKYMIRNMSIFYVLAIFFAVTTRILFSLEQTVIINIIGQISVGCMFSMLFSILINTMMRSWVRFRDFIYKDESYLTHTLPVTKNDIYNSKFIKTFIFFIVGFLMIILGLFIAYYTEDRWNLICNYINSMTAGLNLNATFFIVSLFVIVFLQFYNPIQCGFLGIILGYKKNNNKIGFSVLFGFISYMLTQSLTLLSVFIVALFDSSVMQLFKSNVILDTNSFKILLVCCILVYFVVIGLMNIVCRKFLNQGVNIE